MTTYPRVLFVTGTDTDVGKTITTAALAAALVARGRSVAVYKPTQAGTSDGEGDIDVVRRLTGIDDVHEGIRLPEPMAPVAAAARAGAALPSAQQHLATIRRLAADHDHTLVEGAGGLLVHLDGDGHTLADLAAASTAPSAVVVVCRSGLGTLNHTDLTIEALRHRKITIAGLVIGSWSARPTDIDISNRLGLAERGSRLIGVVPEGVGGLRAGVFRRRALGWVAMW